jgi:hypothetical protein
MLQVTHAGYTDNGWVERPQQMGLAGAVLAAYQNAATAFEAAKVERAL